MSAACVPKCLPTFYVFATLSGDFVECLLAHALIMIPSIFLLNSQQESKNVYFPNMSNYCSQSFISNHATQLGCHIISEAELVKTLLRKLQEKCLNWSLN